MPALFDIPVSVRAPPLEHDLTHPVPSQQLHYAFLSLLNRSRARDVDIHQHETLEHFGQHPIDAHEPVPGGPLVGQARRGVGG